MSGRNEWTYERYRLGELSPEERRELESEPDFTLRMAELDASDAEVFQRYPAADMAAAIRRRAGERVPSADQDHPASAGRPRGARILEFRPMRSLVPLAAAAALLAALIIVAPWRQIPPASGTDAAETLRPKGVDIPDSLSSPELVLYRDGADGIEVLRNGDTASEHDLLQVGFMSGEKWWGGILSVDGNGTVTRHWPLDGDDAVSLGHSGEFLLPYSYELDDAPDFEAFFLVWSDGVFPLTEAEHLLADFRGGEAPPNLQSINPGGKTGITVIQVRKAP